MVKKKSKITLITDESDHGNREEMEMTTEGYIWKEGEYVVIQYHENKALGYENSVMTIKSANDKVLIERKGEYSTLMVIERSKEHYGHFDTPMGGVEVSTKAYKVKNTMTENGGEIAMKYCVYINGMFTNYTHITITAEVV